jgi:hypothetical protein
MQPLKKCYKMKKLSLKQIDDLLKHKDIDPTLKESLEEKKKILTNNQTIQK